MNRKIEQSFQADKSFVTVVAAQQTRQDLAMNIFFSVFLLSKKGVTL